MRGNHGIVSPTTLELVLYRCERLKLNVTFMSTGLEFFGVDGWRRLPGWHGSAPHVLFETRRGEDENKTDVIVTDVFQAHPRLSGKENRASGMDVGSVPRDRPERPESDITAASRIRTSASFRLIHMDEYRVIKT